MTNDKRGGNDVVDPSRELRRYEQSAPIDGTRIVDLEGDENEKGEKSTNCSLASRQGEVVLFPEEGRKGRKRKPPRRS